MDDDLQAVLCPRVYDGDVAPLARGDVDARRLVALHPGLYFEPLFVGISGYIQTEDAVAVEGDVTLVVGSHFLKVRFHIHLQREVAFEELADLGTVGLIAQSGGPAAREAQ